jgi:hypothetical protein
MKVWITKYALTQGVYELEVERTHSPTMVASIRGHSDCYTQCFHGKDWHETEAAALSEAETMRIAQIASLKKRIAKLEKLQFAASELAAAE